MKMSDNPFKIGDVVILTKPVFPFPDDWPPETLPPHARTYAFGIREDTWDRFVGKFTEITSLANYSGCAAIIIDSDPRAYCWPVECVSKAQLISKILCDCPNIFLSGCRNKDHG